MVNRNTHFAGLWPRFHALLVDFLFFCAVFFPITRLLKGVWIMGTIDHRWDSGLMITNGFPLYHLPGHNWTILCPSGRMDWRDTGKMGAWTAG